MRFNPGMRSNGGTCKACGKPTNLLVHQGCGDALAVSRPKKSNVKRTKLNYQKGMVPPFARESK